MIPVSAHRCTPSRFNPSFVPAPSPKTAWQRQVAQADLPFHTKGLLLIVATEWMDADGGSCFPTEQQIMERAGVSRPCLTRHMRIAEERGYIRRWRWGHGNRNRRYNYQATLPTLVENGNDVSYQPSEMGNDVALHEALPRVNHCQEKERATEPEPEQAKPAAVSVPPTGALSDSATQPQPNPAPAARPTVKAAVIPMAAKTTVPDTIPEGWLEQAGIQRPDLTPEQIKASAGVFVDHHRAKGSLMVDWSAAFRVWIARERAPKAPTSRTQAAQTPPRYAPFPDPKAPVPAAVQAALEQGEQRRLELLRKAGIDPTTGLKIGVEPAGPSLAGLPPLPDGSPLPSGERETPEQYRERIEQHRRYQLERLARLMEQRKGGE